MIKKPVLGLGSPAAIEVGRCNQVYVDALKWPFIPRGQQDFIIEHERAHCELDIESEIDADAYGYESFIAQGGDPEDAYLAITENLDMARPDIQERASLILQKTKMPSKLRYFGPNEIYDDQANPPVDTSGWDSDDWMQFLESGGAVLGSLIGAWRGNNPSNLPTTPAPTPQPNYGPYILGGAALLLIGLIVAMFMRNS
ncbi:MAG: hypothetical protein AAFN10_25530 [Bacteroidota bacterium]